MPSTFVPRVGDVDIKVVHQIYNSNNYIANLQYEQIYKNAREGKYKVEIILYCTNSDSYRMKNSSNFIKNIRNNNKIFVNIISDVKTFLCSSNCQESEVYSYTKRRMDTSSMLLLDALCLEKIV